jgi:hypothetical protein
MDHLRINSQIRKLVSPPKLPSQEEVDLYAEELRGEVIPTKIKEFVIEAEDLKGFRKEAMKIIEKMALKKELDTASQHFLVYWVNVQYADFFVIQKWLNYYISLLEMATRVPIRREIVINREDEITEDDVQRAKQHPIEDLYEGNLRQTQGRLTGCCPFHKETTPSFFIFTNDNHFFCFGCSEWGDSIDFYMKTKKVSLVQAVKALNHG